MRERRILDYLRRHGFATAESLAEMLDVAAITARRDLIKLEQQGLLKRVHGGAVQLRNELVSHIAARLRRNAPAKRAIARVAAGLVQHGETLFLDAGSTCYYLAECLPENFDLTVVTHSLDNINVLKQKAGILILCPGGELDGRSPGDCPKPHAGPAAETSSRRTTVEFVAHSGFARGVERVNVRGYNPGHVTPACDIFSCGLSRARLA